MTRCPPSPIAWSITIAAQNRKLQKPRTCVCPLCPLIGCRLQPGLVSSWRISNLHVYTHARAHTHTHTESSLTSRCTHSHCVYMTHMQKYTLTDPHAPTAPTAPLLPLLLFTHTGLHIHTHRVPIDTIYNYTQAHSYVLLVQAYSHLVMATPRYTGHCTLNSPPRQLVQTEKTKLSLDRELE